MEVKFPFLLDFFFALVPIPQVDISLSELINRQNLRLGELTEKKEAGDISPQLLGHIAQTENRIHELDNRKEIRFKELAREKEISISSIQHLGSAWVIPHPDEYVNNFLINEHHSIWEAP